MCGVEGRVCVVSALRGHYPIQLRLSLILSCYFRGLHKMCCGPLILGPPPALPLEDVILVAHTPALPLEDVILVAHTRSSSLQ